MVGTEKSLEIDLDGWKVRTARGGKCLFEIKEQLNSIEVFSNVMKISGLFKL
jgi:hypothetical protein